MFSTLWSITISLFLLFFFFLVVNSQTTETPYELKTLKLEIYKYANHGKFTEPTSLI